MKFQLTKKVMSKIIFIISLIVLALNTAFSQVKIDSSATWTIASISMGNYFKNETFMVNGDSLINSILYKTVYKTNDSIFNPINSSYFCAIRELDNEWFIIPEQDSLEHLLYDFNVKPDDTITTFNQWLGDVELNVFNIDSILLSDKFYKRIELGIYDYTGGQRWNEYWIEGIGSTNGFYLPAFHVFDIGSRLLCFHRNDSLIYVDSPDGTCGFLSTGIKTNSLNSDIKLSPNPVSNQLSIISNHDIIIELYNSLGKKVISSDRKVIDVSYLINGVYFAKIFDSKMEFIKTEKIIKQ